MALNRSILFFILLIHVTGICQNSISKFRHLNQENGLSQLVNAYIFQDSYGLIWISSNEGVNLYDGITITNYSDFSDNPILQSSTTITSNFFEDAENNIWFTSSNALICFLREDKTFQTFSIPNSVLNNIDGIYHMIFANNENIWLVINKHLFWFNLNESKFKNIGLINGYRMKVQKDVKSDEVRIYSYFNNSTEFKGLDIYKFREDSTIIFENSFFNGERGYPELIIHDIFIQSREEVWMATNQALILFNEEKKSYEVFDQFSQLKINEFRGIDIGKSGYIYITAKEGLLVFDPFKKKFTKKYSHTIDNSNSIISNNLSQIYIDQNENLWLSMWGKGIDFTNLNKSKFATKKLLRIDSSYFEPGCILKDKKGHIWLGSNLHGVLRLEKGGHLNRTLNLPQNGIKQIFEDSKGYIWVLYWSGELFLWKSEDSGFQEISIQNINQESSRIREFSLLKDGRVFLSLESSNGIFELKNIGSGFIGDLVSTLNSPNYQATMIFQGNNGNLYIGENDYLLNIYSPLGKGFRLEKKVLIGGEIKCFHEEDNILWIGGAFGLVKLNTENFTFRRYSKNDGLASGYIYGILTDSKGRLWLSTNKGLSVFTPYLDLFWNLTLADGIQGYEYNTKSFLKEEDGRMWFGGPNGYNIFYPDSIHPMQICPKINFTGFHINDQATPFSSPRYSQHTLNLPYRENTVSFSFVASEYSDPQNNRLRYRLYKGEDNPYDRDWVEVKNGDGFARYARLREGSYQFKVIGSNSDGVWEDNPSIFYVNIRPPFYRTWWFLLLSLVVISAITYLFIRAYLAYQLRQKDIQIREQEVKIREQGIQLEKQEALQKERDRVASEMHDDLGSGLTSIRLLIYRIQDMTIPLEANTLANKIEKYAEELVNNMSGIIWAMNSTKNLLSEMISYSRRYIKEYFDTHQIPCSITVPDQIPEISLNGETRRNLFLCLKEGTHNIVKHAQATQVKVAYYFQENNLHIIIQDDGLGIPAEKGNSGNGLINMQNRMEQIGGSLTIQNKEGTQLTFILPIEEVKQPKIT